MTLAAGTKLGRYEIRSPLGAGGMREVYLANDTELDRTVAIKILPQAVAKIVTRGTSNLVMRSQEGGQAVI